MLRSRDIQLPILAMYVILIRPVSSGYLKRAKMVGFETTETSTIYVSKHLKYLKHPKLPLRKIPTNMFVTYIRQLFKL